MPAAEKVQVMEALLEMLRWFSGKQIRNVAVSVHAKDFENPTKYLTMPSCFGKLLF